MKRLSAILVNLPLALAVADTIELKTGEKIEGKIVETTPVELKVQVQFSPTIVDERIISRDDIAHFAADSGDEMAFEKIRDVQTPDTVLRPEICEALINEQLQPFLQKFPKSPRAPDVQKQVRLIRADISRLRAGGAKLSGAWFDKASFTQEKYQIEAATLLDALSREIAAKDYPAAMNSFDQLQRTYPNSAAYLDSVTPARIVADKLQQQLNLALVDLPLTKARRQAAIDRTPPEQRQPVRDAVAAEDVRAADTAARAQKKQQRFFPLVPFDEKGLRAMQTAAQELGKKLQAQDPKALRQKADLVRRAHQELSQHQLDGAAATLAELRTAWPVYEALPRLEQRLENAVQANEASAAAAAKAQPAPPP